MYIGLRASLFMLVIICSGLTGRNVTADQNRFIQDRFAIGFWVDPPADGQMDQHYKDIADANFTLVIGGFGASTPETVQEQVSLCEKYGLKVLVSRAGLDADQLPESPTIWGYRIRDEPSLDDFAGLSETVSAIREARPGRLAYINLFPNYANTKQLGTTSYDEHVRLFLEEVGADVLSLDHYPIMTPDRDTRSSYCNNLGVMRKYSLKEDIPFWNFFNTMPYGSQNDPTEAQLKWQIYTSLAYGAKGVLYFCYWTPPGKVFTKGGAIITLEGRKTRHYEQARRINREIKNLGPTLMKLTSTGVYRPAVDQLRWQIYIEPEDEPSHEVEDQPITDITEGDYLIGVFRHDDGRQAVLINNYNFAYTAWPTLEFKVPADQVKEVCKETGKEIPVLDDSPAMEGLQISLDAGEGRLFLLPAQ